MIPSSSYPSEYVINESGLPAVDISAEKYREKSTDANEIRLERYNAFQNALQIRDPTLFQRVRAYYRSKQEKLISELKQYDYRLDVIKHKKEIFEAMVEQLNNLPPSYLAHHALEVAKARPELESFRKSFNRVECIQTKIEAYFADKIYRPGRKKSGNTWQEEYLTLLRNEAARLTGKSTDYFDIFWKVNKLEEYQKNIMAGRSKFSQDRINHKIKKADLLLSVLLYGNPESAWELAAMRVTKEPIYVVKKEKALASLAKAKAKEKAWEREELCQ